MTATLESCMILIEAMQTTSIDEDEIGPVALSDLATDWRERCQERGLVGEFIDGGLPIVEGHRSTLQQLLSSALHAVRSRSSAERPHMMVEGEMTPEGVTITVSEAGTAEIGGDTGPAVALAALMKLLAIEGGTLVSRGGGADGNRLVFALGSAAVDTKFLLSNAA